MVAVTAGSDRPLSDHCHMTSTLRGALLSLAAFGFYATHDVVVKFLGANYTAFQLIFFSGLMGFPLVTMMLMGDRRDGTLIPRHPWWTALRSVAAVTTGVMGFFAFSKLPMLCDLFRHAAADHPDGDPDAG
jgi:S-adenosylmethionine uptake transporter